MIKAIRYCIIDLTGVLCDFGGYYRYTIFKDTLSQFNINSPQFNKYNISNHFSLCYKKLNNLGEEGDIIKYTFESNILDIYKSKFIINKYTNTLLKCMEDSNIKVGIISDYSIHTTNEIIKSINKNGLNIDSDNILFNKDSQYLFYFCQKHNCYPYNVFRLCNSIENSKHSLLGGFNTIYMIDSSVEMLCNEVGLDDLNEEIKQHKREFLRQRISTMFNDFRSSNLLYKYIYDYKCVYQEKNSNTI